MNDSQVRDMVISHDKVLDSLSGNIKSLTFVTGNTNTKLDKVVEELSKQNVLIERMNNMDKDLNESFNRVYGRLNKIETAKDGDGCNALKMQASLVTDVNLKIADTGHRLNHIEKELPKKVSYSVVQWALGFVVVYAIAFGTYTVNKIQDIEKHSIEHSKDTSHNKEVLQSLIKRVQANEDLHRNMGVDMENIK